MRGDILVIGEQHRQAAQGVVDMILDEIAGNDAKYLITVGGESGAGKSELASAIKDLLDGTGIRTLILQQDDYFVYPPLTNARVRLKDIHHVGPGEVKLDILNDNIRSIRAGQKSVEKPLVIFQEDRITSEIIDLQPFRVVIIEGTYTTLLENIDCRIFIDRDRADTREDRMRRNREKQDEWLEQILEIEHSIITRHKLHADIIINKEFKAHRP
jgi:uridine kinase